MEVGQFQAAIQSPHELAAQQYGQRQQRPSYKEKFTECRDRLNTANNIREDLDRQLAIAEAKLRALEDECGLLLDVLVHQSAIQHGHPLPEYGPEHQQFLQSHQGHHAYAYAPPYRADPGPPEVYNPAEDATMSYRGGPPVPPPPPMERLSSNGSGHREYSHRPMSGMPDDERGRTRVAEYSSEQYHEPRHTRRSQSRPQPSSQAAAVPPPDAYHTHSPGHHRAYSYERHADREREREVVEPVFHHYAPTVAHRSSDNVDPSPRSHSVSHSRSQSHSRPRSNSRNQRGGQSPPPPGSSHSHRSRGRDRGMDLDGSPPPSRRGGDD
ncbi:hypothetical protein SISSUDRAFT_235744 [Sistotremastrum suecicum HHB10207 ss-3]|uniref:Uncharacterized protein n=1 Tax=Sistotremastrum suecicum HHB10207 ss-3 TaxID=1314776 RepID=A0A166GIK4_9AGAM|nr:hypothetical protein SISSUDRAFT_235744 [Sistotremastrum suecicum HHB10207 ss-3]